MLHRQFAGPAPVRGDGGQDDLFDELSLLRNEVIDDLAAPHLLEVFDADEFHRRPVGIHRVAVRVRDADEIARVLHYGGEKPPLLLGLLARGDITGRAKPRDHVLVLIEYGHRAGKRPTDGAVGTQDAMLHFKKRLPRNRVSDRLPEARMLVARNVPVHPRPAV